MCRATMTSWRQTHCSIHTSSWFSGSVSSRLNGSGSSSSSSSHNPQPWIRRHTSCVQHRVERRQTPIQKQAHVPQQLIETAPATKNRQGPAANFVHFVQAEPCRSVATQRQRG